MFAVTSRGVGSTSSVSLTGLETVLADTLGLTGALSSLGVNASGKIAGVNAIGIGSRLIASSHSTASGLALNVYAGVASATIEVRTTVSRMIAGIQKQLSSANGGLTSASAAQHGRA